MSKEMYGRAVWVSLLCLGLGLGACKKDGEGDSGDETVSETPPPVEDTPTEVPPVVDEPVVVEEVDAGAPVVEVVEVDEALFIKALYEVTCVQGRIEDTEKQKGIIEEVYARYGFDGDSFKAAQASVGEQENVKAALKIRMEKCTSEAVALAFAKAGDTALPEEETKSEEEKKAPARKFAVSAPYTARGVSMGKFNQGEIKVVFTAQKSANGQFQIRGDGVFIKIPLRGSISTDGQFNLSGSKGANNNIRISGNANTKSASGTVSGKLNSEDVSGSFTANK